MAQLCDAIDHHDLNSVQQLLSLGVDPNEQRAISGDYRISALSVATARCELHKQELIETLLRGKANPECVDSDGSSLAMHLV